MGAAAAALALHAALNDTRHMVPWQLSAASVRCGATGCMRLSKPSHVWHCGHLHPCECIAMRMQSAPSVTCSHGCPLDAERCVCALRCNANTVQRKATICMGSMSAIHCLKYACRCAQLTEAQRWGIAGTPGHDPEYRAGAGACVLCHCSAVTSWLAAAMRCSAQSIEPDCISTRCCLQAAYHSCCPIGSGLLAWHASVAAALCITLRIPVWVLLHAVSSADL